MHHAIDERKVDFATHAQNVHIGLGSSRDSFIQRTHQHHSVGGPGDAAEVAQFFDKCLRRRDLRFALDDRNQIELSTAGAREAVGAENRRVRIAGRECLEQVLTRFRWTNPEVDYRGAYWSRSRTGRDRSPW